MPAAIRPPIRDPRLYVPPEERDTTSYHEFRDNGIIDEWTFRGDGRETVQWFNDNSNYDELMNQIIDTAVKMRDVFKKYI